MINYVDNKKLYEEMCKYKAAHHKAIEEDRMKPRVPEYVGECILLIANRLSTKYQFCNYQYREDMVSDGVENCLLYIDNFNPEKSENPFSYFTQIIYYAFLRRIQNEKKHLYLKYKLQSSNDFQDKNVVYDGDDKVYSGKSYLDAEKVNTFITDFENYMTKKKTK